MQTIIVRGEKEKMRLIDADAFADDAMNRYCKDCTNRKGIKNGKYRIIYEIGEAPCRACAVDDMIGDLENAPTVDAVEVVRCKDCKWYEESKNPEMSSLRFCYRLRNDNGVRVGYNWDGNDFCSYGERRENE